MNYIVKKKGYTIDFSKDKRGVICCVSKKKEEKNFCIVNPGNIFYLVLKKWCLLDTTSIKPDREFRDFIDKASYELPRSIVGFLKKKLTFRTDEYFFIEAIIYDLYNEKDLDWLPGKGNVFEFVDQTVIVNSEVYDMLGENGILYPFPQLEIHSKKRRLPALINPILNNPLKIKKTEVKEGEKREIISSGLTIPIEEKEDIVPEPVIPTISPEREIWEVTTEEMQ